MQNLNPQMIISQFGQFMQNPSAMLSRAQIPGQMAKNPDQMIQYLLDSGRISQGQYNMAQQLSKTLSIPGKQG